MKLIKKFSLFEEETRTYSFSELSPEAKKNAIQNVREEMWEGSHGAYDIGEWVIDDDFLFEPTHDEMVEVFGPNYEESLSGNPMIYNDRDDISYISKEDRNYYLHCRKALNITNDGMFLGWLGIPPYFWDYLSYSFTDSGTYTQIEFELDDEESLSPDDKSSMDVYLTKAENKFKNHMDRVLTRITNSIESQYEDGEIEERIESQDIIFDEEGNTI